MDVVRPRIDERAYPGTDLSVQRLPRSALMDVVRPRIDERAYLGTDKSVPYKKPCKFHKLAIIA
ncbi:MAG: hypothetical protein FWG87_10665 [Defluviitaleaceae bacterium]|nr:hypothetical protein [Defluviitaleaceae bacterium]